METLGQGDRVQDQEIKEGAMEAASALKLAANLLEIRHDLHHHRHPPASRGDSESHSVVYRRSEANQG